MGDLPHGDASQIILIPRRLQEEEMSKRAAKELKKQRAGMFASSSSEDPHQTTSQEQEKEVVVKCLQGHKTDHITTDDDFFFDHQNSCSSCQKDFHYEERIAYCAACDYYLCKGCFKDAALAAKGPVILPAAYLDRDDPNAGKSGTIWQSPERTTQKYLAKPSRRQSIAVPKDDDNYLMDMLTAYYRVPDNLVASDMSYSAPSKLLAREALRFSPAIHAELDRIWAWADMDKSGGIDMQEYIRMFRVMHEVVIKEEELPDDIDTLAMTEFLTDSGGDDILEKDAFCQSFLQLADTWTNEISEEAYMNFLKVRFCQIYFAGAMCELLYFNIS
jgi:hypothetical protein